MTEDHWKPNLLLALLPFLFLSGSLVKECHGQSGSNYFYYFTPTQRTMVNHGLASGAGQIFNSPFYNQQQHQQQSQQQPEQQSFQQQQQPEQQSFQQQQQQVQPNFPFPTAPPSFQQSTLLGYNHPQFQRQHQTTFQNAFPPAPPAQLQYPLVAPTPAQQSPQQQQILGQQTSPAYNTFTRFGNNPHLLGQFPQPSQPSFLSTQSPLGTVPPGTFNFFQNPFQYLQQRLMDDVAQPQPTPIPDTPARPTPTTAAPSPPPPQPTPTTSEVEDAPVVEQVAPKRSRFSSRFRYVQQPPQPQIRQYNPYSAFGSPYTSDLPYTEQRFYSSPTTPTGYAFALGGDDSGNGATSTVHFSMGPTNNIHQYLTEITATRKLLQRQRTTNSVATIVTTEPPAETMMSHDAPSPQEPVMTTTMAPSTTTPAPAPQTPEAMPTVEANSGAHESTNSTLEPLLNEPSFRTETIASPAAPIPPEVSRKISETNIPKRLITRMRVAKNRLMNATRENGASGTRKMPNGVMIRRRIPNRNRLPVEEPKLVEEETPKGPVIKDDDTAEDAVVTPSTTTTTTTTEPTMPEQMVAEPEMDEEHPPQENHIEHQPSPSTTSPSPSMDVQMNPIPVEEAQMSVNQMSEQQMNNDNDSFENLRHFTPPGQLSSTTAAPEEMSGVVSKETVEMQQPEIEYSSTTTPPPIQTPPLEAMMAKNESSSVMTFNQPEQQSHEDDDEYYALYEDEAEIQDGGSVKNTDGPPRVMTAVMAPESSDELPLLDSVKKEDFPGVFHTESSPFDNSVETDQGQLITRITSSHQSSAEEAEEMVAPPSMPSPPPSMTISSTTTTEEIPVNFARDDPVEEHPPMDSEEPTAPEFQPTTTEAPPPMMTTTSSPIMSSTTSASTYSAEMESTEEHDEENNPESMPSQENQGGEASSAEVSSSTTEAFEDHMPEINDMSLSSTTESLPQDEAALTKEDAVSLEMMNEPIHISSTTEANSDDQSSSTFNVSSAIPEVEMAIPSSTESTEDEISTTSSTTMAPPSATTEATSKEEPINIADAFPDSQEIPESLEDRSGSQENPSESEEIGKAQRVALEETLQRLREKQLSTSTNEPQDQPDNSPENEVLTGRRVFMRRPIKVAELSLPTSRPIQNSNAVLDEGDGVDRSQVIQKIQKFRQNRPTTTKRPRRVTRPSPSTERNLAVVEAVEDLPEGQVDSFSDSSSTPGTTAQPPTTTTTPRYSRSRTTPLTRTTTVVPEESSTTPPTMTMEDEMIYPIHTTTSTETFTTTPLPPMLTRFTDESSSTTETMMGMVDEVSSTTETDFEIFTSKQESDMTAGTFSSTTTEAAIMTTTTPAPIMARTTTTSTTTYAPTMTDFSSDETDDYVFYEENPSVGQEQVSSSTETSTEVDIEPSTSSSTTTTTSPPSSTDPVYAYVTTAEPISSSATTTTYDNDQSSTTFAPDFSSSTMTATPAGQLIIHEILPTMPPQTEVSSVIGDSIEDDQSSAIDTSSANESDELLGFEKAVVRVEAKVHISTNATDIEGGSVEQSQESQELTSQPASVNSGESGERGQRRVVKKVVKIKKSRRQRRPEGRDGSGDGRRRRRKVFNRRPQ